MSRPTSLVNGSVQYWVLELFNEDGEYVDADATPTVTVRRNGSSTGESVTVTKRSSTTGIYDCSHTPAAAGEGVVYHIQENATVASVSYSMTWQYTITAVERGTDSALLASNITLSSGQVTVATNNDKTGYALSSAGVQSVWEYATRTLTSFGSLASDVWSAATRTLTSGSGIVLSKGTGVTGFSDPSAADIRSEIDANSTKLDIAVSTRLSDASYVPPDNATIAAIDSGVSTLLSRITSTLFSGITSMASWMGALAGKSADITTRAEINDTVAGASYNETTDSQEAIRDRGDSAWTTGGGGGGGGSVAYIALPAAYRSSRSTEGSELILHRGETGAVYFRDLYQADAATPLDLTGRDIIVSFRDETNSIEIAEYIASVTASDLHSELHRVSWVIDGSATTEDYVSRRGLSWSIRDVTGGPETFNQVLLHGVLWVRGTA